MLVGSRVIWALPTMHDLSTVRAGYVTTVCDRGRETQTTKLEETSYKRIMKKESNMKRWSSMSALWDLFDGMMHLQEG